MELNQHYSDPDPEDDNQDDDVDVRDDDSGFIVHEAGEYGTGDEEED